MRWGSADPRALGRRVARGLLGAVALLPGLLLPGLLLPACATRTDQRVRAAWGGSSDAPRPGGGPRGDDRDGEGSDPADAPILVGWARLDEVLDTAVAEAALGTDDEVFARLAERWCDTSPEPQDTEGGPVFVCRPNPPVTVEGHAFTLELGGEGVIGLVAAELSAEASASLARSAIGHLERWCTEPWTDVSPPPNETHEPPTTAAELHTCHVEGSALLVVARFVSDAEAELWRVSVAVLDAS